MSAEPAYRIQVEERDLVVRLRRGVLNEAEVSKFLDYLELESLRSRSELAEEDAEHLARDVDSAVWQRVRGRLADGA
jgi:hypothetical protein